MENHVKLHCELKSIGAYFWPYIKNLNSMNFYCAKNPREEKLKTRKFGMKTLSSRHTSFATKLVTFVLTEEKNTFSCNVTKARRYSLLSLSYQKKKSMKNSLQLPTKRINFDHQKAKTMSEQCAQTQSKTTTKNTKWSQKNPCKDVRRVPERASLLSLSQLSKLPN